MKAHTIAFISLVVLAVLVIHSANLTGKAERYQAANLSNCPPPPAITGSNYNEVLNSLFVSGGR